jgi:competence protein ComEC
MPFVIIMSILISVVIFYRLSPYFGIKLPKMEELSSMAGFTNSASANDYGNFSIHSIDVGQGDSELIKCGSNAMLVDAGTVDHTTKVVNYLNSQHIKRLDYVIATHPHEDHIGGLDTVIKDYDIGEILMPKKSTTTNAYENLINAISEKKLKPIAPEVGKKYNLGEAEFTILAPSSSTNSDDLNAYSIVIRIVYRGKSFLLEGDATSDSEQKMLESGLELKSDVLKVAHHGSSTSSIKAFIEKVSPKYAVISVGVNNVYNHPAPSTVKRLQDDGAKVLRTDINGTVVFYVNNDGEILYKTEKS